MAPSDRLIPRIFARSPDARSGLLLFGASLILAVVALRVLDVGARRPKPALLAPPRIEHFAFGAKHQIADSLWIRAIQDFDYCAQEVAAKVCVSNGWLYRVLDLITDLSPRFRIAYATGGLALTILVNDMPGASKIFDKGLRAFPNDLSLLERAGYHALYEEKDERKAAELIERAAKNGAPPWYYMLATRLYNHQGQTDLAEALLASLAADPRPDPVLLKTLRGKIEAARSREKLTTPSPNQ